MIDPKQRPTAMTRRTALGLGVGLVAGLSGGAAIAQSYPSKPIRIIVGFVPGGSTDFGGRMIAAGLADALGVSVVVENRAGATGVIATEYVANSPPDGYTLLVGTATPVIIAPQAMGRQSFNALTDLTPVNMVGESPMALAVNPKLGVKRLKDLVALSRTRPVTVGTSGVGGALHLLVESLIQSTGGNFVVVPYKGTGPTVTDAIAGHIDATVSDIGSFLPFHNDGKLLVLGIASEKRMDALPDIPTLQEDVPGTVMVSWTGLFAPGKTPKPIIDTLNAGLMKMIARDDVRKQFVKAGATVYAQANPAAFQKLVANDYQRFGKLIKERGIVIKE
ncbi:tripartite tricarboxylate transporter substrate binding protein [Variovorax sp. Sphag1AA]|uniref:Bug family tripartite tricarboxylate transporter substrate binding protein n=1 Tax=Variovorax sp. Sphag1AA TaxID=2587027 RepID=UPI0016126033|nr:tripartite tricarboxylate transporter substrate binding protein [Variovorax sp. Sphag1AA]MBB3181040.1 tripartite-type tricarboxylate transporter receptor subunit TctC [Variovorax sp. Sphag1AA]